jgi:hypothetical protein
MPGLISFRPWLSFWIFYSKHIFSFSNFRGSMSGVKFFVSLCACQCIQRWRGNMCQIGIGRSFASALDTFTLLCKKAKCHAIEPGSALPAPGLPAHDSAASDAQPLVISQPLVLKFAKSASRVDSKVCKIDLQEFVFKTSRSTSRSSFLKPHGPNKVRQTRFWGYLQELVFKTSRFQPTCKSWFLKPGGF